MKIAMVTANTKTGQPKNMEHCIFVDKNEASLLLCAMEAYCKENPRKKIAKSICKQFENELNIF